MLGTVEEREEVCAAGVRGGRTEVVGDELSYAGCGGEFVFSSLVCWGAAGASEQEVGLSLKVVAGLRWPRRPAPRP